MATGDVEDFERYRRTGDRRLRNELVQRHEHLVGLHVRRFGAAPWLREDVRQVALVGLIQAVERFDPARGVPFAAYADRTISGELKRFARNQSWTVRPPRALQEVYLELSDAETRLLQQLGRTPTTRELADELGCEPRRVREAMAAGCARRSMACEVDDADAPAGGARSPAAAERGYERVERRMLAADLLATVPDQERTVVELTVMGGLSQVEVASALGVSQSSVSRSRRHALERMRRRVALPLVATGAG